MSNLFCSILVNNRFLLETKSSKVESLQINVEFASKNEKKSKNPIFCQNVV